MVLDLLSIPPPLIFTVFDDLGPDTVVTHISLQDLFATEAWAKMVVYTSKNPILDKESITVASYELWRVQSGEDQIDYKLDIKSVGGIDAFGYMDDGARISLSMEYSGFSFFDLKKMPVKMPSQRSSPGILKLDFEGLDKMSGSYFKFVAVFDLVKLKSIFRHETYISIYS